MENPYKTPTEAPTHHPRESMAPWPMRFLAYGVLLIAGLFVFLVLLRLAIPYIDSYVD